jgi:hypothetical protein
MSRNGKIARLPQGIREELNRRLRDGKAGPALLRWLNELEECQDVLDEEFDGRPITKQNLSEWRQGGYEDWVRKEEARQRVQVLMEKAGDLERDAGGMAIADRLGTLLAAELAVAMEQLDSIQDPNERWARLKDITREVYRLRREDHHARRLRMAEEQYERREKEAEKEKLLKVQEAMQNKHLMVSIQGGGDETWKWTDWRIRVRHGLPMPLWWRNPQTAEEWSELMLPHWREEAESRTSPKGGTGPKSNVHPPTSDSGATRGPKSRSTAASPGRSESRPVTLGQTKSDQKSGAVAPGQSESEPVAKEPTEGNGAGADKQEDRTALEIGDPTADTSGTEMRSVGDIAQMGTVGPKHSEDEDENEDEYSSRDENDSGGNGA